jgi:uncharacterized protein YceK
MKMNKETDMKLWKHNFFMLLAVLSLLLSACGPVVKLDGNAKNKDKVSQNENGNETDDQDAGANKITICHKTGSAKHPYIVITVSKDALQAGHAKHDGDIIPAPEEGCPSMSSVPSPDKIQHNGDETESDTEVSANKITICHKTGSAKHPYVVITVSNDATRDGHAKHEGDVIPAPKDGCPSIAIATDVPAK